jgi:hypothetical protein
MPGRPLTKARKEREARAAAIRPIDPERKAEALALAAEHGAAEAARRTGVSDGTIRTWMHREKHPPKPPRRTGHLEKPPAKPSLPEPSTRAEKLWREADEHRERAREAESKADGMLRSGKASEARNASVLSGQRSERARDLEAAAREHEDHESSLSEAQGKATLELIEAVLSDLALAVPRELLRARLESWPNPPDAGLIAAAQAEARRALAAEVRAEITSELREQISEELQSEPESDPVEPEPEPPEGPDLEGHPELPAWDTLPEEIKFYYGANRLAGRTEHFNNLVAERQRQRVGGSDLRRGNRFSREFAGPGPGR